MNAVSRIQLSRDSAVVEQRSHNPHVAGSIPAPATTFRSSFELFALDGLDNECLTQSTSGALGGATRTRRSAVAFISERTPGRYAAGRQGTQQPRGVARHNDGGGISMRTSRSAQRRNFQSRRDHNLPRNGNVMPRERYSPDDVAKGQSEVLQAKYGRLKSPAKEMARDTGNSERACRNQIAGLNNMNLADFFNACLAIPEIQKWGAMMMGLAGDPAKFARELSKGAPGAMKAITLRFERDGVTLQPAADDE